MSTLSSGAHWHIGRIGLIFGWWGCHRHHHLFGAHHFQPGAPDVATWPVSPKHWATSGGGRSCENRCRGKNLSGRDRPEHCADPSWLFRVHALQARGAEVTRAAIPDASGIQQTIGAIALGSSFLGIERMMGGTEQISIRLERKSRSWKTTRKRPLCPVRGAIHQDWWRFTGCYRLADGCRWWRLGFTSRSKFYGPHGSGRKVLPEFQAEIPDPLAHDLPKFLPTRRMRTPTVRILLDVFIRQNGFKGPAMQIHVQHIFGGKSWSGKPGDEQFVDHAPAFFPDRWGSGCGG